MIWERTFDEDLGEVHLLSINEVSSYTIFSSGGFAPYRLKMGSDLLFGTLEEAKKFCEDQIKIRNLKPCPDDVVIVSNRTTNYILKTLVDQNLSREEVLKVVANHFADNINPEYALHCLENIFQIPLGVEVQNEV